VHKGTLGICYEQTRQRIVDVIRAATSTDEAAASRPVPACPGWRVRDVLAHLSGNCTDVAAGNIADAGTDAWTAAQVDARRDLPLDELVAESNEAGPMLAAIVDDFPGRYGEQMVADITVHEHDIRGALGMPGARDSRSLDVGLDFLLCSIVAPGAAALGVAPLQIRTDNRVVTVGAGNGQDSQGDPAAAIMAAIASPWPPDNGVPPAAATGAGARLDATPFELFRAFTGRRSHRQVRGMQWSGDPAAYDALFGLWPFTRRDDDLRE
jgi:uncharacterized protein (TIGR03083 family)